MCARPKVSVKASVTDERFHVYNGKKDRKKKKRYVKWDLSDEITITYPCDRKARGFQRVCYTHHADSTRDSYYGYAWAIDY